MGEAGEPHPSAKLWPSVLDAQEFPLAEVYASAALETLPANEQAEEAAAELADVVRMLATTPELDYLLFRAPLSVAARSAMVGKMFTGRCSPTVGALLGVLARHDRLRILPVVAARFRALLDRREGKVDVTVTSAVALDDATRKMVTESLTRRLGAQPVLHEVVDPRVVGGLVVNVGGKTYDDSIRSELDKLRRRLAAASRRGAAGEGA